MVTGTCRAFEHVLVFLLHLENKLFTFSCRNEQSIRNSRKTLFAVTKFWNIWGIFFSATRSPFRGSVTALNIWSFWGHLSLHIMNGIKRYVATILKCRINESVNNSGNLPRVGNHSKGYFYSIVHDNSWKQPSNIQISTLFD